MRVTTGPYAHDLSRTLIEQVFAALRRWPSFQAFATQLEAFEKFECFLVGGAIRNIALGCSAPKDFDFIFVGEEADDVIAALSRAGNVVRGSLGSPCWIGKRHDKQSADLISITSFDQGFGSCNTVLCALSQFDFTGNALALNLGEGTLLNPYYGYEDLRRKKMRVMRFDYPDEPIRPHIALTWRAAVWFRILHYAAKLNLEIEPATLDWLVANEDCFKQYEKYCQVFPPPNVRLFKYLASQVS
uniref:Poly A polymerase head domain-containing protein n=1 Tax=mine drainage metagenome TaxID=410659 RepID=E6Q5P4_9ZZZZ